MTSQDADDFRLTVLNPGGRDPEQHFQDTPAPGEGEHPPVNFHAFAACTRGVFHYDTRRAIAEGTPVLLLHQIAQQSCDRARLSRFMKILAQADGCIATTPEAAEIYRRARCKHDPATVAFIPTPYPIEDRQWNFSVPPDEQAGIFIGTREWDVPSRNHFAALLVARQLCEVTGEPVTVVNLDGFKARRLLWELRFPEGKFRLIEEEKPYPDYLRVMARHKIVLQLDRSSVPGQVAGDALLCRIASVGGDGAIERIAFPKTCGKGQTIDQVASIALELLKNAGSRAAIVAKSQQRALERLSFQAVRCQLAKFFARLADLK